jgi:hypothetical protein
MTVNPSAHLVSIEETEEDIRLHWRFTALMPVDQARQRLQEYFERLGYALVDSNEQYPDDASAVRKLCRWIGRRAAKRRNSSRVSPLREIRTGVADRTPPLWDDWLLRSGLLACTLGSWSRWSNTCMTNL